jgi:sodium-dependent dicarboxylate transporter 2/3/5
VQRIGLFAGPALAALTAWLLPERYADAAGNVVELSRAAHGTLALMVWMAVWWLTEAIEIYATALLPIAVLPLLGAAPIADATRPYAHKLIFLFLGGFVLALAMQRWGLDRRITLLTLRGVGTRPSQMVAGIMLATAFLSMFVSNTATAVMMLPIALSMIDLVGSRAGRPASSPGDRSERNFPLCLMLGIAYAATLGGIATKIGTPPNGLLLAFIEQTYGQSIDFFTWLRIGLPLVVVFLPITWLLLTRVLYPVTGRRIAGADELLARAYAELGPMGRGERTTLSVFAATALGWVLRPILAGGVPEYGVPALVPGLSDAGIAMLAAIALFVIPVDRSLRRFVMDWETARRLPWGVLILFGGGLSLAAAVRTNGVDAYLGNLAHALGSLPPVVLVMGVTALVIVLTELTSNTATTATLLPVLAGAAPALGVHPYLLIVPAAVAASCAFMLPVATPPNAVIFASGFVSIPEMSRAGLWLNLVGVALVTMLAFLVVVPVLGVPAAAGP